MRDFYDFFQPTYVKPGAFVQMPERVSVVDTIAAAEKRRKEEMAAEIQAMQLEQAKQAMEYAKALSGEFSNKSVDPADRYDIMSRLALEHGQIDDAFKAQDRLSAMAAEKAKAERQVKEDELQQIGKVLGFDKYEKANAYNQALGQRGINLGLNLDRSSYATEEPKLPQGYGTVALAELDSAGNVVSVRKGVHPLVAQQLVASNPKQFKAYKEPTLMEEIQALKSKNGGSDNELQDSTTQSTPPVGAAVMNLRRRK